VKPAPFEYVRVARIGEAIEALARREGDARCLAGGQSLVPLLNMRLMRPSALVDLNGVAELDGIAPRGDGIRVGALVRYAALERSAIVAERLPLVARALPFVGDRQIRNRGTLGGALCHADPAGEMALAAVTLGARLRVAGPTGVRDIAASEFFQGSYATALGPADVLVEVLWPDHAESAAVVIEHARRHGDFAVVSVAAVGRRGRDGAWERVSLGLGGVADRPLLAESASALLSGTRLDPEVARAAAAAAAAQVDPASDVRASADYRRHLLPIYVERALAALRAGAEGGS